MIEDILDEYYVWKMPIAIPTNIEWDDDCDFAFFLKEIDEQIRLRIPDKYLKAYGWL